MLVGVPREIKDNEYRVGLTPESVYEVVQHGHQVLVERGAGDGIGAHAASYEAAGATVVDTAPEIFARSELVVKVKEPQAGERAMLRPDQVLFTYLHLAPDPEQTRDLVDSGAVCIAYETVTSPAAACRCWRPCPRWPAACRCRPAPTAWSEPTAARACCSAACPGWTRPRW